jgi:hypothetical protein
VANRHRNKVQGHASTSTIRCWIGVFFALALAAATPSARAAQGGQRVRLSWVRAESASQCPDASHLEADVTRRLERPVFAESAAVSIEVAVSRADRTWKAHIEMRAANGKSLGSRTVTSEAPGCASLASAASLAVALMIEPYAPERAGNDAQPAPAPAATEQRVARIRPVRPAETSTSPLTRRAANQGSSSILSGAVAVVAATASDVLPRPAFGIGLEADVDLTDRLYLAAGGQFFPQERLMLSGVDVAFSMTWGSLGGCYRVFGGHRLRVVGCASALAGAMHSVVFSQVPWQRSEQLWLGAKAGAGAAWSPAGPFEIRAALDALVPARRRTYAIEGAGSTPNNPLFTEPAVSAVASIGVGIRY